jgi:hypothetical protein
MSAPLSVCVGWAGRAAGYQGTWSAVRGGGGGSTGPTGGGATVPAQAVAEAKGGRRGVSRFCPPCFHSFLHGLGVSQRAGATHDGVVVASTAAHNPRSHSAACDPPYHTTGAHLSQRHLPPCATIAILGLPSFMFTQLCMGAACAHLWPLGDLARRRLRRLGLTRAARRAAEPVQAPHCRLQVLPIVAQVILLPGS